MEDSAAYIYNIKTKGDIVQDTSTAAKREIEVKWRSEYLSIDQYSEYLVGMQIKSKKDENENSWSYINIEVLPYASINLTFYKNEKFIKALETEDDSNKIDSVEAFQNLVQVSIITE